MSFLSWLFNGKPCRTCDELRKQIEYEREVNRDLVNTIKEIVVPKQTIINQTIVDPEELKKKGVSWNRRRAELERNAAQAAMITRNSQHIAKPDIAKPVQSVEELEKELGITEETENVNA